VTTINAEAAEFLFEGRFDHAHMTTTTIDAESRPDCRGSFQRDSARSAVSALKAVVPMYES